LWTKSLSFQGEATKNSLKLDERPTNVYENKGSEQKASEHSGNVIENTGAYQRNPGMLLKTKKLIQGRALAVAPAVRRCVMTSDNARILVIGAGVNGSVVVGVDHTVMHSDLRRKGSGGGGRLVFLTAGAVNKYNL
jgi:hypothetical protein